MKHNKLDLLYQIVSYCNEQPFHEHKNDRDKKIQQSSVGVIVRLGEKQNDRIL